MSNSKLVSYTKISPNSNNPRNKPITKITIHHVAGNATVESIGNTFAPTTRQASSNYGVGSDGRIGMYVEEKNRSWCSSNAENDHQAITIEVANDKVGGDWHVSDKALAATIDLCVDICQRNGIDKLNFTGNKNGNLTMHCYFAPTACPGPYLKSKFPYIEEEVNKRLKDGKLVVPIDGNTHRVRVGNFKKRADADNAKQAIVNLSFWADGCTVEPSETARNEWQVNVQPFKNADTAKAAVEKIKRSYGWYCEVKPIKK